MASDIPTTPLSIRVAVETAQKFQSMATQRGLKAGALLETLIALHEREQVDVPDGLKDPFKTLEGVLGEIKAAWLQKDQERDGIIENQLNLQEENSKLLVELKNLNEKLESGAKEIDHLKRALEKEKQISSTFTAIAVEYQAKIEELRQLEAIKKDVEAMKLQIEKLILDKEKLEFALSKSSKKK